jgi:hypothetical protein
MKKPFQPLPDGEPMLSLPQFLARLKNDPGFAPLMQRHYEAALALPEGPDTADMQQAARRALAMLKHHQGAWHAKRLLEEAQGLFDRAEGEPLDLGRMEALMSEAIDHLLDVQEPERSRFMAVATGMREKVRGLREG